MIPKRSDLHLITGRREMTCQDDECSICLCKGDPADWIQLACDHWFHGECILKWFMHAQTCPMCRSSVTSPFERTPTPIGFLLDVFLLSMVTLLFFRLFYVILVESTIEAMLSIIAILMVLKSIHSMV